MSNASESAFPNSQQIDPNTGGVSTYASEGLTKLEYFAGLAMQGILANPVYDPPRRKKIDKMAEDAVSAAKALIAELEKQP